MPVAKIPHDYHLHTNFSFDGHLSLSELCDLAIELGIPEICTTDHADYERQDEGYDYFNPDAYFAELERCRERYADRLTIRAGVEVGEAHRHPEEAGRLTGSYPFDFVIGSLHWVGSDLVMSHRYFDGKSVDDAYRAYFDELLELVRVGDFDVVGHLDVPKRYGFDVHGPFDPLKFAEQIREVLRVCIDRGIGIEINTGSMRRAVGEPSPTLEVLQWYREMGGEILTLGSDGHRPNGVGFQLEVAVDLARAAGFSHVATFESRRPRFVPIE